MMGRDPVAEMGPLLAVDVGSKRVGVAAMDALGMTAQPVEVVLVAGPGARGERGARERVAQIAREQGVRRVVVGMPKHMRSGDETGQSADMARRFGQGLVAEAGLEVVYWDERLTSALAEQALNAALGRSSRRKKRRRAQRDGTVDMLAARLILQSYVDATRARAERPPDQEDEDDDDAHADGDA